MEKYEKPSMEIVELKADVITGSCEDFDTPGVCGDDETPIITFGV